MYTSDTFTSQYIYINISHFSLYSGGDSVQVARIDEDVCKFEIISKTGHFVSIIKWTISEFQIPVT